MFLSASVSSSPRLAAARELLAGLLVAPAVAGAVARGVDAPGVFVLQATALYAVVALGILLRARSLADELGVPGLGPANRVTLARVILALPVTVLLLHPGLLDTAGRWWAVGLGTVVLSLDGVDGWVARRTGTGTRFGARFDMESDAAFILVLALLVWVAGRAPGWVLLVGAMRYLFVAGGWILPALRGDLPPSRRRKVVCVVQGVALLVALGPIVPGWLALGSAGVALALLAWSFGVDTLWLLRNAPGPAVTRRAA